jgi:glycerol-3-phosphate dehydrogenase
VSIFGGKITTYRRLAEAALAEIGKLIGAKGGPWTAGAPLPGGGFPVDGRAALERSLVAAHGFLRPDDARRLVRLYGTRAADMVAGAASANDMGEVFDAGLTAREVDWLISEEWASSADDILWRRTKLGLRFGVDGRRRLEAHINRRVSALPPAAARAASC